MPSSLKTVLSATLALLATVGLSLAALRRGAAESANPPPAKSSPPFAVRELYAVGHFGNSYEVMGEYEMRRYLAEAKRWGFNRYADWFDMEDCSDPFAEKGLVLLSHAMWERKKQNFRSAQALGLSCDLVITPNHVYVDQCRPALLAKKGPKIFGQLICPSQPEARAMILKNYETCSPIWPGRACGCGRSTRVPTTSAAAPAKSAGPGSSPLPSSCARSMPSPSGIISASKTT
jgi:hypothetical protein